MRTHIKNPQSKGATLQILLVVTGELQENCWLLWQSDRNEALIFDAGAEAERINAELKKRGLTPAAFLQTHCHGDHIGALADLKAIYPQALIYAPEAEAQWLRQSTLNLSYFLGANIIAPEADCLTRDGDEIKIAGLTALAIHVPGHSPGGTAYFVKDKNGPPHLFCGDILFAGNIGRADLPGSAGEKNLTANIRAKLFTLPDETIVHSGHGSNTTISKEKANNIFCKRSL